MTETPHDLDLERRVIGTILSHSDAILDCATALPETAFYDKYNNMIYKAAMSLFKKGKTVNLVTVATEMRELYGEVDAVYLSESLNVAPSARHLDEYIDLLCNLDIRRKTITYAGGLYTDAQDIKKPINTLLTDAAKRLMDVSAMPKRAHQTTAEQLRDVIKDIESSIESDGITGVPSGYHDIDRVTGGWQKSSLIILAARPAMGKSMLAVNMADNAALQFKKKVVVVSLEMNNNEIHKRRLSRVTGYNTTSFRRPKLLDWNKVHNGVTAITTDNLWIWDDPSLTIHELRGMAARHKARHGLDLIVLDYLQLLTGEKGGNRENEVSSISRGLKVLAKELDIPVIALSQLSRSVEQRGSKRPTLSNLRESGAIEQDADMVAFIHRPEYYGDMQDEEGFSTVGMAEFIISKHRGGALADIRLRFDPEQSVFSEWRKEFQSVVKPNADFDRRREYGEDDVPF
jgi:replicative DNA helicase